VVKKKMNMWRRREWTRQVMLPYCFQKQKNGNWVALCREYQPLGYDKHTQEERWWDYDELPGVHVSDEGVTVLATNPALRCSTLRHNDEAGDVCRIYLYKDSSRPELDVTSKKRYAKLLRLCAKTGFIGESVLDTARSVKLLGRTNAN
jgi:hypothetical protein